MPVSNNNALVIMLGCVVSSKSLQNFLYDYLVGQMKQFHFGTMIWNSRYDFYSRSFAQSGT